MKQEIEHAKPGAKLVIYSADHGYLLRSIDGWGKAKPEWTNDPYTAMAYTAYTALTQRNFLQWAPHRIKTECRVRSLAPVHARQAG